MTTYKHKEYFFTLWVLFTLILLGSSCAESRGKEDNLVEIVPSDLAPILNPKGSDASNPNGDGSGILQVAASAKDAALFKFEFEPGETKESTSGISEYAYKEKGANVYRVKVTAYSSTNDFISISESITIYVAPVDYTRLVFSDEFDMDGEVPLNGFMRPKAPIAAVSGMVKHSTTRTGPTTPMYPTVH